MMKQRKGMTLVEIMLSLVLIGFLVLMVGGAVTSTFVTSTAMQKLPGLYFKGQQEIETDLDDLDKEVTRKYLLEKELMTQSVPNPSLIEELNGINANLAKGREKITVSLFGKNVVVYQFEKDCTTEGVGKFSLCAGTAGGVRLDRPVPVIENATINVIGQPVAADIYDAVGKTVTTDVTYADINRDYCYAELYQWYVSTGDTHAVYYADGTPGPDELQHGTVMPVYPDDFTPIVTERTASIVVSEAYRGKFIFCLVTPLSVNGKMGSSVMSNLIYVSALPTGLSYKAVIDPSLTILSYDESGRVSMPILNSMSAASGAFIAPAGCPRIDLNGDIIANEGKTASRYLHFGAGESIKSSGTPVSANGDKVFAVVRRFGLLNNNFISVGTRSYGFANYAKMIGPTYGGWVILQCNIDRSGASYIIGGENTDIAELIIVSDPGSDGITKITEYLKQKYDIR